MAMSTETELADISPTLRGALAAASARHKHLCPRQVLGARIGMAGGRALQLDLPRTDKRLLVIVRRATAALSMDLKWSQACR